ncbi:MAG: V-type ATPase 116kDa subunit family protein [Gammaproteobacteria bacterium]|jgi:V/A-type H+-transporting ATPase subunit I
MSLRPARARWFELLTTRDDLTLAVEALAGTGSIELETHSGTQTVLSLQNLQQRMEAFNRLAQRYRPYWPQTELRPGTVPGRPGAVFDAAMQNLRAWEQAARPLILRLESLAGEQMELRLLDTMLRHMTDDILDFGLLARQGESLGARLFALPARSHIERLPGALLTTRVSAAGGDFLLAVGLPADLDTLGTELAAHKARVLRIPLALHGTRQSALRQVGRRTEALGAELQQLRQAIDALAAPHHLHESLADIYRLDWFVTHVSTFPVSENFAWITGWTSDLGDTRLTQALHAAQVDAVLHFPPPPRGVDAPVVMQNPWWAQPFEMFARLLGTPARDELDPSRLLAVLAPLLFGYMFGDVGHGLVLLLAGLFLQRRWPVVRLLIANGISAMAFGLVFGSIFGREDVIPALWVHPTADPLPVLLVPLAGGIVILLLGLLLNAVEAWWRGAILQWWQVEAAVVVLYVSIIAGFFHPGAAPVAVFALLWYFTACLLRPHARVGPTLLAAAGTLIESVVQLLINTVSFVRVGAFALAHGGLSLAFTIMAAATDSPVAGFLILLLGNLVVIMLEGLVVTVQTTRLILFEFFIRFLRGSGRMFRPLAAPDATAGIRRIT